MAEIALGVPGLIDVITRGGFRIVEIAQRFVEYERAMANYMKVGFDLGEGMSFFYLETVKRAWQNPLIPQTVKVQLDTHVRRLHGHLLLAIDDLRSAKLSGSKNRIRYALGGKRKLERRFKDLENDSNVIHKLGIDLCIFSAGLHSSILIEENFALIHETQDHNPAEFLPTSDILIAKGNYNLGLGKKSGLFVVEGKEDGMANLKSLCHILRQSSAVDGIPDCLGFRKPPYAKGLSSFELIMEVPSGHPLASLAHRISTEQVPIFDRRLQIGKALAQAVFRVHSLNFVHKSIRPRSILFIGDKGPETLFLHRWRHARNFDSCSAHLGEHLWQQAIYQHPDRQSRFALEGFETYHDIYSLGVCLLEIFLWTPFTVGSPPPKLSSYDSDRLDSELDQQLTSPAEILALFETKVVELGGDLAQLQNDVCEVASKLRLSQEVWMSLARTRLAALNQELAEIVEGCLRLDYPQAGDVLNHLCRVEARSSIA